MNELNKIKVSPTIFFLTDVIERISSGDIKVPKFQRDFVWKPEDILSLFDSITKGYPIGSLLFWKTSSNYQFLNHFGPFKIKSEESDQINLVLDGHQRLSTLFGCLCKESNKIEKIDDSYIWNVYYDLENQEFLHLKRNNPKNYHVPINSLINTIDFLQECKRLSETTQNSEKMISRAENISQKIRNYKIAVTQLEGSDLDSAVEVFSRLNSKGRIMSQDEMFAALTYREGENSFHLANRIDQILDGLDTYNFSNVDRVFIFRSIIAASRRDVYKVKLERLASDKSHDFPKLVDGVEQSLHKTAIFLSKDIGVPSSKHLPYNMQLVVLSEFFYNCKSPNSDQLKYLKKWFWFTSYTGWFAGANNVDINHALEEIRQYAVKEIEPTVFDYEDKASSMPERFDFRYARIKTYVLFLFSLNPLNTKNKSLIDDEIIIYEGAKALQNFEDNNNSFENKFLIGSMNKKTFRSKLMKGEVSQDFCKSHGIPFSSLEYLRSNNIEKFLKERRSHLGKLENDFMENKGVKFSYTLNYIIRSVIDSD